jgi:hypothetical protein
MNFYSYKPFKKRNLFPKFTIVFLLGLSFALFFSSAFTIVTGIENAVQYVKQIVLTSNGTTIWTTWVVLDWATSKVWATYICNPALYDCALIASVVSLVNNPIGDNLWDHTAAQNIRLWNNYLSYAWATNEWLRVFSNNNIGVSKNLYVSWDLNISWTWMFNWDAIAYLNFDVLWRTKLHWNLQANGNSYFSGKVWINIENSVINQPDLEVNNVLRITPTPLTTNACSLEWSIVYDTTSHLCFCNGTARKKVSDWVTDCYSWIPAG